MSAIMDFVSSKNKKLVIGIGSAALVLAAFGLSITTVSAKKTVHSQKQEAALISDVMVDVEKNNAFKEKIDGALSVIDKRLSLVQNVMEKNTSQDKDGAVNAALKDLSQTVVNFKTEAQQSLIKSHEENEALAKKIQALQDVIATLKGGDKSIQYLDKKALPFEVLAIDSVNEEAILALRYNYNHVALEKGDKLAGWRVINLDYAKQRVEFDDDAGAHVKIAFSDKAGEAQS